MRWIVLFLAATAVVGSAAAADGGKKTFDLPAGGAAGTLALFAQQADCEIMFPSGPVGGVEMRALKGDFIPREALSRLVAGTDLTITEDEKSGVFAVTRRAAPGRIVGLPPYIVAEARAALHWRYAEIPGFEILSCCPGRETEEFGEEISRQQAALDEILPPDLQGRSIVPTTLILLSDEVQQAMFRNIAALVVAGSASLGGRRTPPDLMPQVKLWDDDSVAIDVVLAYREPGEYRGIGYTPNYLLFLLNRRVPHLPPWFIEGIMDLYRNLYRQDGASMPAAVGGGWRDPWLRPTATYGVSPRADRSEDDDRPVFWIPPLKPSVGPGVSPHLRPLPRIEEIFNRPPVSKTPVGSKGYEADWSAEAALFVRWVFDDEGGRRRALWRFVERSGSGPPPEAVFKDCFGLDFAGVRRQLTEYRLAALKDGFILSQTHAIPSPQLELRDAAAAETARILGDWERKEIEFVRGTHPEFAQNYVEQANRTLGGAYEKGERDPGLVAALGLYECAVGNDGPARDFLEAAVRGGVVRPSAYVELARLRLASALASPGGKAGKLSDEQIASVLDLLGAIRSQPPPQLRAYLLAAETWEHSGISPTAADLAFLDEGARNFPNDSALVTAVGRLKATKN